MEKGQNSRPNWVSVSPLLTLSFRTPMLRSPVNDLKFVIIALRLLLFAGHIYAIGECGGATEEGKCPDCQATIGGRDHQLAEGNQLAAEMDQAQAPAWPTMGVRV